MITDGRFSGATQGACIGHITPEAYLGGPIAMIEEGDTISIDIPNKSIELEISKDELEMRTKAWKRPSSVELEKGSLLDRYRRLVGTAVKGSVLE